MTAPFFVLAPLFSHVPGADLEEVRLTGDDLVIRESCRVVVEREVIEDDEGDGVLHIVADGVTVELVGRLHGAPAELTPDSFEGVGVRVEGEGVTLRGGAISGFRAGVRAVGAHGLTVEDLDVSGNRRHRLLSTPAAEVSSDWLWPHDNDQNEWFDKYGAGIYVEESAGITIRRVRAREGQNGICLREVDDSRIYDNDCSFLSGWGLALFRSSRNTICRNSFDFCVRGYSHGVYSRGQDSAGILAFEQCSENVIAYNSATHSGDGFFGFTGSESLESPDLPARTGNNGNLLYGNDFSYAPAIGIEMTFSFDNVFVDNKLVGGNYGVWGGYSKDTWVARNEIRDNAIAGVAVEHGSGWKIQGNRFEGNRRGVQLWWDEDEGLMAQPWSVRNGGDSRDYVLADNRFRDNTVDVELRKTTGVLLVGNELGAVDADEESEHSRIPGDPRGAADAPPPGPRLADLPGEREAVGLRAHLAGRDKILMTEWGPYGWEGPYLAAGAPAPGVDRWRVLGGAPDAFGVAGEARVERDGERLLVRAAREARVTPYTVWIEKDGERIEREGLLVPTLWDVRFFAWETDPREDVDAWRAEAAGAPRLELPRLHLPYASGGPSDLPDAGEAVRAAALPRERFGTLAETRLTLPAGDWLLRATSDDGVRVWVDDEVLIDNWTWHAPTVDEARVELAEERDVRLRVEHFELDGYSTLTVELLPAQ